MSHNRFTGWWSISAVLFKEVAGGVLYLCYIVCRAVGALCLLKSERCTIVPTAQLVVLGYIHGFRVEYVHETECLLCITPCRGHV